MMRNNTYTVFREEHLMLSNIRDDDDNMLLSYIGDKCPFSDFVKSKHGVNRYVLIVEKKSISNAYKVRTYGRYKSHVFGVFSIDIEGSKNIRITTNDVKIGKSLNLTEISPDGFIDDINESELDTIWEERMPTRGLPMPEGLEAKVFLKK